MNGELKVLSIDTDLIIPNRFQPRLVFDEKALDELATSVKEHGIIQPLILRMVDDKYEIIAGERRYKAALKAGLSSVPAIVTNYDDNKSAEVAVIENVQRSNLNSLEEAKAFRRILDKGYLTQEQLAQRLGLSQSSIANKLRLLNLDSEVQKALMQNKISERHARSLLQLDNNLDQINLLNKIISERLTVRQLDEILSSYKRIDSVVNSTEDITPEDGIEVDSKTIPVVEEPVLDKDAPTDSMSAILSVLSPQSAPSLEDEETNMSMDSDNLIGGDDYFNPFLNDSEEETFESSALEEAPAIQVSEVKEEPRIISNDLDSVKKAYVDLKEEVEKAGFDISSEEFDFEDIYQLIIKINKQEQT